MLAGCLFPFENHTLPPGFEFLLHWCLSNRNDTDDKSLSVIELENWIVRITHVDEDDLSFSFMLDLISVVAFEDADRLVLTKIPDCEANVASCSFHETPFLSLSLESEACRECC